MEGEEVVQAPPTSGGLGHSVPQVQSGTWTLGMEAWGQKRGNRWWGGRTSGRGNGRGVGLHLLRARARDYVVGARALVSCDELGDVDGGPRAQGLHVRPQLLLQPPIQYLRAPHRLRQVQRRYVPAWGGPSSSARPQSWAPLGLASHTTPDPGPRPPSNTRSSGATMGSSELKGTNTSWPSASRPRLTVPACVSEP